MILTGFNRYIATLKHYGHGRDDIVLTIIAKSFQKAVDIASYYANEMYTSHGKTEFFVSKVEEMVDRLIVQGDE